MQSWRMPQLNTRECCGVVAQKSRVERIFLPEYCR
jgi:hypothetical protein